MTGTANEDVLYVDGVDMSGLNLWVSTPSGWADGPLVSHPGATLGGRAGHVVVTREASIGGRDMVIPASLIVGNDLALLLQRLRQIKRLLYAGAYVHLRFGGAWNDREALVQVRQVLFDPDSFPGDERAANVQIQVHAPKPYMQARRLEVYTLVPGDELPLVVGDAPSDIDIRVHGPTAGTINIRVFSAAGVEVAKLVLKGTALLAGESLYVRGEDGQILKYNASNQPVEAPGYLDSTGDFLTLDHGYAIPDAGIWPYLTIDSGTATIRHRQQHR